MNISIRFLLLHGGECPDCHSWQALNCISTDVALMHCNVSRIAALPFHTAGEIRPVNAQTAPNWRSKAFKARQTHWRAAVCLLTRISHSCG